MIKYLSILFLTTLIIPSALRPGSATKLNQFFDDYATGLLEAKAQHKPILLWFTGNTCKENRDNQALIIESDQITDRLNDNFITIILHVDDRTKLDEVQVIEKDRDQLKLRTYGAKWAHLQITKYQSRRQPFLAIIDYRETRLLDYSRDKLNENDILKFLKAGIIEFEQLD